MKLVQQRFADRVLVNHSLAAFTTFGIGGNADYFLTVTCLEELIEVVQLTHQDHVPFLILGGGSNLLISDLGIEGLVLHNQCKGISSENELIRVQSGTTIADLQGYFLKNKWTGGEFLAGIPGTVGGAVCGNAGAYGRSISDLLVEVTVLTRQGETRVCQPKELDFDYRESRLKESGEIVLEVVLRLEKGDIVQSKKKIADYIENRQLKHPSKELGCAGSYFKNIAPPNAGERRIAAGFLLEKAGAKQFSSGGAAVFHKHANMIVNQNNATAQDVLTLAEIMKREVKSMYDIILQEEVRFIGRRK